MSFKFRIALLAEILIVIFMLGEKPCFGAGYYNIGGLLSSNERVVTSGLVLHLDASRAKLKNSPYPNGCAGTDLIWKDLSPSALDVTLTSFASCGDTSG